MRQITGRCLCGQVQYAEPADVVAMFACHCKDCQRSTGTAFLTGVSVPTGTVTFTGELRTYTQPGGTSGLPLHRRFCPNCGSTLAVGRDDTGRVVLAAGTLDDTSFVKPTRSIFCQDAQAWVALPADIPNYHRYE